MSLFFDDYPKLNKMEYNFKNRILCLRSKFISKIKGKLYTSRTFANVDQNQNFIYDMCCKHRKNHKILRFYWKIVN